MTISKPGIDFTQSPGSGMTGTFAPIPGPVDSEWDISLNPTHFTLSNNDKTITGADEALEDYRAFGTVARSSGKRYFEIYSPANTTNFIRSLGLAPEGFTDPYGLIGENANEASMHVNSANWTYQLFYNSVWHSVQSPLNWRLEAVTIGVAVDLGTGEVWFSTDNAWKAEAGSPDPGTGTDPAVTLAIGSYVPAVSTKYNHEFTLKTLETDLMYSIPSGFQAWGAV